MSDETRGAIPQYQRIRRRLEAQIRRGELPAGHRIPGERDLASQYGVSQMTANRAIQELVRDGLLLRRAGSGTYVRTSDDHFAETAAIVLIVPFTDHPEFDTYLQAPFHAISTSAAAVGRSLVVVQAAAPDAAAVVERHPHSRFLFAAPNDGSLAVLGDLHARGVPFVVMGASWPDAPFACVDTDNAAAEETAVGYLTRLGHRRIAFVNGPIVETNNRDRLEGYLCGLEGHGLTADTDLVIETTANAELDADARRRLVELLVSAEPVTAVLCAGFSLTLSVLGLLRSLELRAPEDVSIVGFDDPPAAEHLGPPLTTFRQPLYALGARAVERVMALRPGQAETGAVEYLPIEFVPRGSCARVALHEPRGSRTTGGRKGRGR